MSQPPQSTYPPNLNQNIYFANFGPIWMKLDVEVKIVEQSLNLEFEVVERVFYLPTQPNLQNAISANFDEIWHAFQERRVKRNSSPQL